MTSDVSVRAAWPADASAIATIQLTAWQQKYGERLAELWGGEVPTPEQVAEAWRESLNRPPQARNRALVALAGERVVGFALTGPATDEDADPSSDGEIGEFTIAGEDTGSGHGSRLLQAAVDTLVADRFTRALWWIDTTDDTLRRFLATAGWEPDGAARELSDMTGGRLRQVRLHVAV